MWAGNVLVEINRTAREAKGAMTCSLYRAERQLSFTFQSKQSCCILGDVSISQYSVEC